MTEGENPYYKPGIIRFESELMEATHKRAIEIAGVLGMGDITPLPDEVTDLLQQHTEAINNKVIGRLRQEIAKALEATPYLPSDAMKIGTALMRLVEFSNAQAVEISMGDIIKAEQFRRQFPPN